MKTYSGLLLVSAIWLVGCSALPTVPPAPTAVVLPTPTPPSGQVLFADDFTTGLDPRWSIEELPSESVKTTWITDNGWARIQPDERGKRACGLIAFGEPTLDNYALDLEVTLPLRELPLMVVMNYDPAQPFRNGENNNTLLLYYDSKVLAFRSIFSGVNDSSQLLPNAPTHVRLSVQGLQFRVWVNGESIYDYGLVENNLAGRIGFLACVADNSADTDEVAIDRVVLYDLSR